MKSRKLRSVDDLFEVAEKNDGYLLLADNKGKFWVIEQLKRVNDNFTVSQECVHEWIMEEFDHDLNTYLQRRCTKCKLLQRKVTGVGEWTNAGKEK